MKLNGHGFHYIAQPQCLVCVISFFFFVHVSFLLTMCLVCFIFNVLISFHLPFCLIFPFHLLFHCPCSWIRNPITFLFILFGFPHLPFTLLVVFHSFFSLLIFACLLHCIHLLSSLFLCLRTEGAPGCPSVCPSVRPDFRPDLCPDFFVYAITQVLLDGISSNLVQGCTTRSRWTD